MARTWRLEDVAKIYNPIIADPGALTIYLRGRPPESFERAEYEGARTKMFGESFDLYLPSLQDSSFPLFITEEGVGEIMKLAQRQRNFLGRLEAAESRRKKRGRSHRGGRVEKGLMRQVRGQIYMLEELGKVSKDNGKVLSTRGVLGGLPSSIRNAIYGFDGISDADRRLVALGCKGCLDKKKPAILTVNMRHVMGLMRKLIGENVIGRGMLAAFSRQESDCFYSWV
jgi:hypothetical protein